MRNTLAAVIAAILILAGLTAGTAHASTTAATQAAETCRTWTWNYDIENRVTGITATKVRLPVTECWDETGLTRGSKISMDFRNTTAGDFFWGVEGDPGTPTVNYYDPSMVQLSQRADWKDCLATSYSPFCYHHVIDFAVTMRPNEPIQVTGEIYTEGYGGWPEETDWKLVPKGIS
ncbi:hypothetical protein [Streptomyces sp. 7N604]|uniref:hypothetical protein n=1 Tax=Streptomyces sp. 7N604 TaxID=3457415 RepID=UPI003FCF0D81